MPRLVLDWSPLPIAVVDSQYRYRYVSPIFQMMQGLSDREIVEKSVADIWGLQTFYRTIKPFLDRRLRGEESTYAGWVELLDGDRTFMVTLCTPQRPPAGAAEGAAIIAREVAGLKLAAEAQQQRVEQRPEY